MSAKNSLLSFSCFAMMATLLPGADLRQTLTVGVIVVMVLGIIAILEMPLRREP